MTTPGRLKRKSIRRPPGATGARPEAGGVAVADKRRSAADERRAVILARGLTKRYGEFTAVDHLDLEVMPGEVFGLLGPNGAGKTTTVLMLLGLSEPTDGIARVVGLDPARDPLEVKRHVGYMPDNVGFYGELTGRDNMRYTGRLNGLPRAEADERIDDLLHEVRLQDAADRKVETYSRGMRQRLGIADALVKDPSVLILDEPTIAIDPAGVEEILALLRRLVRERSLTILLSSHILGQVQSVCDRVGFFSAGRLVAAGRLDELAALAGGGMLAYEVGAEGAPEAIEEVLRGVDGVVDVERGTGELQRWTVRSRHDVAAGITSALTNASHPIVHLRRRGEDLYEIYRSLVPEENDGRIR